MNTPHPTSPPDRGGRAGSGAFVLAATILGSSMAFIDGSVVGIALPVMQADLGGTVRDMQWVVNAYMLLLGALILVGGSAGDRFGRRRIYTLGLAIFTAASVACGLAPNVTTLIAARALQGIGGALLVPGSLSIITASFAPRERGRAIGTWSSFSALTTALGPVLGGWLVDIGSWRAIFFINVPIAALAIGLTLWRVPESRDESADAGVDWRGGLLATLGLGALAWGLTAASGRGWTHPVVVGALLAGAAICVAFIRSQSRSRAPMVPLDLFRSTSFSGANAITLVLYFALSGALFLLPFNLIQVQGYTAAAAGAAFLPFSLILAGLSRWSGALADRHGARRPLIVGPLVAAAGFALFAVPGIGGSWWTTFFPPMAVLGLGMAITIAPLTTTVMGSVSERHSGAASGINNAVARIAGTLAVALLGTVAIGVFASTLDARLTRMQVPDEVRTAVLEQAPRLAEAQVPSEVDAADHPRIERALDEAFVRSFRVAMLVAAALAALSSICAALTIRTSDHFQETSGER